MAAELQRGRFASQRQGRAGWPRAAQELLRLGDEPVQRQKQKQPPQSNSWRRSLGWGQWDLKGAPGCKQRWVLVPALMVSAGVLQASHCPSLCNGSSDIRGTQPQIGSSPGLWRGRREKTHTRPFISLNHEGEGYYPDKTSPWHP